MPKASPSTPVVKILFAVVILVISALAASCGGGQPSRPIIAPDQPIPQFTTAEKVVRMSTVTVTPTMDPQAPLKTVTAIAAARLTLESYPAADTLTPMILQTHTPLAPSDPIGPGSELGMIADELAQIQLSLPAGWNIQPVDEATKAGAPSYTTVIESPGESYPGGQPMRLELLVANENNVYEATIKGRLTHFRDTGVLVESTEDWTLLSGEPATVWRLQTPSGPAAELLTVIDGRTIVLTAHGDLFLFNPIAASLQRLVASKPGG